MLGLNIGLAYGNSVSSQRIHGDEFYLQPAGTDKYLRPDGTSFYLRY